MRKLFSKGTKKDGHLGFLNNTMVLIYAIALTMVWRGVEGLLDLTLFPKDALLSHLVSFLLGLVILWTDDFRKLKEEP